MSEPAAPAAPTTTTPATSAAAPTEPTPTDEAVSWRVVLTPTVLVAALGYFVDLYDLLLYKIVRTPSLEALGVAKADQLAVGITLDNTQQVGLLVGGFLWGALGDRRGRASVLYASILMYSLANIANAFVPDLTWYRVLRFIAGVGLAGELGVAITLVSEVLPARVRGYGTTIIATVGVLGAVAASLVTKNFSWKAAYVVGGSLGLLLLVLRIRMAESALFHAKPKATSVARGNFLALFTKPERAARYLAGVLLAVPTWYVIGLLMTYATELAWELGVDAFTWEVKDGIVQSKPLVTAADTILWCYLGLSLGDLLSGILSQALQSRRKVIALYFAVATAGCIAYFTMTWDMSPSTFFVLCFVLGLSVGYWAMVMQMIAEMFGTNLRATVTTSSANVVRATVIPMTFAMKALSPTYGLPATVAGIGVVVFVLAVASLLYAKETFGRSLDFDEE